MRVFAVDRMSSDIIYPIKQSTIAILMNIEKTEVKWEVSWMPHAPVGAKNRIIKKAYLCIITTWVTY
jgi:hypothetical protein